MYYYYTHKLMKRVSNFDEHCMVYLCINQLNLQALAGREPQGGGAAEIRNPELVKAQQRHQNSQQKHPTQDILKKKDTVPSRERSHHLPPCKKWKTIDSKVPEMEEICDRSQEGTWIHMDTQATNRFFMAISKTSALRTPLEATA